MESADWREWSRPRLEAELEMDGQRLAAEVEAPAPIMVASACICRNGHQPDAEGLIYISPSCQVHGLRNRDAEIQRSSVARPGRRFGLALPKRGQL
jgi:hypothetical protein